MKNIISIIVAGMLMIIINTTAQAQTVGEFRNMTAEQKTQFISDSLKTNLNLTDDQYTKVKEGVMDAVTKIAPIMHSDSDRMAKGKQVRSILLESEMRLKSILTPEQAVLYESKKKNIIAYYHNNMMNRKIIFNPPM